MEEVLVEYLTKDLAPRAFVMTVLVVGGMPISTEKGVAARYGDVAKINALAVTMTTVARAGDLVLGL